MYEMWRDRDVTCMNVPVPSLESEQSCICVLGVSIVHRTRLCKLQKKVHSTRSASDKAYQLLAHGRGSLRVLRLLPPLKLVAMI